MTTNKLFTRRHFLKSLGVAGAGIPLMSMAHPLLKERMFSGPDAWKIFMFSKHLQFLDYDETAQTMKDAGLDGADLTVRSGGHVLPENATTELPRAIESFEKRGLKIGMITTDIIDPEDKYTEPILKIASEAGIKYYRTGSLFYIDELGIKRSLSKYRKQFEKLAEINEKYKIHGAYQNHSGTRVGSAVWDLWMIFNDFPSRWMGCQYDIRHATVEGGESWPLAFKLLQDYIKNIVIKDFKWVKEGDEWKDKTVPLGQGMVNYDQYFNLLKELNLQFPLSLHFEYPLYKGNVSGKKEKRKAAVETISRDVDKLKSMLEKHGLI